MRVVSITGIINTGSGNVQRTMEIKVNLNKIKTVHRGHAYHRADNKSVTYLVVSVIKCQMKNLLLQKFYGIFVGILYRSEHLTLS